MKFRETEENIKDTRDSSIDSKKQESINLQSVTANSYSETTIIPGSIVGAPYLLSISSQITIDTVYKKQYDIIIPAKAIKSFIVMEFTLKYDDTVFGLTDLYTFTKKIELNIGTIDTVNFIEVTPGQLKFTVEKPIPDGKEWSGVLVGMRLKAKKQKVAL